MIRTRLHALTLRVMHIQPLTIAVLLGAIVRVRHLFLIDNGFPYRLGGLYYAFAEQIQQNFFQLPATMPYYTLHGIPLTYPPLAFYLEAFFIRFVPKFILANFLPPILAVIGLVAFALVAKRLFKSSAAALTATLIFAFMPQAWTQQIEAGGLTEAMGTLWLIGMTAVLFKPAGGYLDAVLLGLFAGLGFISAPGTSLAAGFALVLFTLKQRPQLRRPGYALAQVIIAAAVTALVIAPVVIPVITYHGLDGYLLPLHRQGDNQFWYGLTVATRLDSTGVYAALTALGLIWALLKRHWIMVGWTFGLMCVPREGTWMGAIPIVLLMAGGIGEWLLPTALQTFRQNFRGVAGRYAVGGLIVAFLLVSAALIDAPKSGASGTLSLYSTQLHVLTWMEQNLPPDAQLILLTSVGPLEWGPEISERTVLNTIYGAEWDPENNRQIDAFNRTARGCGMNVECYTAAIDKLPHDPAPLYILMDSKHWLDHVAHDIPPLTDSGQFVQVYKYSTLTLVKDIRAEAVSPRQSPS